MNFVYIRVIYTICCKISSNSESNNCFETTKVHYNFRILFPFLTYL